MPLLDIQRQMRELGRIRTGEQVVGTNGRKRPAKLATFRITSPSREIVAAAAEAYGGEVHEWQSPAGRQWEVVTTAETIDIVIPPGQALSQWWELWKGGGCERRCDGYTNVMTEEPCACPVDRAERRDRAADGQACKPTTRLNVMLPALPDLGVFRLESHGYYAAVELAGTAAFLEAAMAAGRLIRARLRLDQREKKVPGKPTNRFAVPVIEIPDVRLVDLLPEGTIDAARLAPVNRRERTERPALGSGPAPLPSDHFVPSVASTDAPAPPRVALEGIPASMTRETFGAFLEEHRIAKEFAKAEAGRIFPGIAHLDDLQRAELAVALTAQP